MAENIDCDGLETVVDKAHDICNKILLFEAIGMGEDDLRLLLNSHHVFDYETQNHYLELVRDYDEKTSREKTSELFQK